MSNAFALSYSLREMGPFKQESIQKQLNIKLQFCHLMLSPVLLVQYVFADRAATYPTLGMFTDAIAECSSAIALYEQYFEGNIYKSHLFEMIRDYEQEVKDLERLVSLGVEPSVTAINLKKAYCKILVDQSLQEPKAEMMSSGRNKRRGTTRMLK
uniref:Uncharacterized protein n=1 Tax=Chenopodium quinoa TaxID=63459 RepID=A0A803MW48_CHEQI